MRVHKKALVSVSAHMPVFPFEERVILKNGYSIFLNRGMEDKKIKVIGYYAYPTIISWNIMIAEHNSKNTPIYEDCMDLCRLKEILKEEILLTANLRSLLGPRESLLKSLENESL